MGGCLQQELELGTRPSAAPPWDWGLGTWGGGAGMKGRCPVGERLKRLASRATSENQRGLSALEEKTTSLW